MSWLSTPGPIEDCYAVLKWIHRGRGIFTLFGVSILDVRNQKAPSLRDRG
jgi:hypothetical protein